MITLTRRQARNLRIVFRRSALGISHRGSIPPLVLCAEATQVCAKYRYADLAVDHRFDGVCHESGSIALPLDALADVEGRDESPVTIEAAAPDRTVVQWSDRGIPQTREYSITTLESLAAFPKLPLSWFETPADLLDALTSATTTGGDDNTRYALGCILLRPATGEIIATDGCQLLIQGGFRFPFDADVLLKRSPIFANKALPRDQAVSIARADTHLVIRAGSWTVFLEIQNVRFPRIENALPVPGAATTRLSLDAEDASFLGEALDRLPGADVLNSPTTLDLNGCIAVRARGTDQARVTELVLAQSRYTGAPVRVSANREFLARAIQLGFTEVEISGASSPVVCRDRHRAYGFQPLSEESAIAPTDDVIRIESPSPSPRSAKRPVAEPRGESPMPDKRITVEPTSPENGQPLASDHPDPNSLAALIDETVALHEALSDTKARAGRLVVALRRYRRRERLVNTTLASLKALNLQDVAGS